MNLKKILRPHILQLKPYSSARDEFTGKADVYLDANENAFGSTSDDDRMRRYPDPYQSEVKEKISRIKEIPTENIFLGNGSDEPIDLIIRACCRPAVDNIIIMPPTYGMYQVSAELNDVEIRKVPLNKDFSMDAESVLKTINENTKLIFICSPNNPSGNSMDRQAVRDILASFEGLVVIDEAYIDFSKEKSFISELATYSNMVILQTFSKAWGLAALRLGMCFAHSEFIAVLSKIKPPYNINGATQEMALNALDKISVLKEMVEKTLTQREYLRSALKSIPTVREIYPSDANFLLVKIDQARKIYDKLIEKLIIVRDRSGVKLCEDCLRITVGNQKENDELISQLKKICL